MHAKISMPLNCNMVIDYHEKKVDAGVAELIYAHNFLPETELLTTVYKKERFRRLNELNSNICRNTLQVVLSFPRQEQLAKEKLIVIATDYMTLIGWQEQPYLIYEHRDAGAPHLHIVSSTIRSNGAGIKLHYIGKNLSVPASNSINDKYGLMSKKAENKNEPAASGSVERLQYGKVETYASIQRVLDYVWRNYRFTDMAAFNAVLGQFNMRAFMGRPGGRIHRNNGLLYQMLNDKGKAVGARVKASDMPFKAGLAALQQKYEENSLHREQDLDRIRSQIRICMQKEAVNMDELLFYLKSEKISGVPYCNEIGLTMGYIFISNETFAVAMDRDLGEQYTLDSIAKKMALYRDFSMQQAAENKKHHI